MSDREIMDSKPNWTYSDTKVRKKLPDARAHQIISFFKSGVRILGYFLLLVDLEVAVTFLILSEMVGIVEELV